MFWTIPSIQYPSAFCCLLSCTSHHHFFGCLMQHCMSSHHRQDLYQEHLRTLYWSIYPRYWLCTTLLVTSINSLETHIHPIKALNGSGLNREPNRNRSKIRFGLVRFLRTEPTFRFGFTDFCKKKCKNRNNSASSDRNKAFYSSLESSHRDESNGGKTKSLASIDR